MASNPAMRSAKQIAKQMVMSDWATGRRVPPQPNNKRRQCEVCGRFINARGECRAALKREGDQSMPIYELTIDTDPGVSTMEIEARSPREAKQIAASRFWRVGSRIVAVRKIGDAAPAK